MRCWVSDGVERKVRTSESEKMGGMLLIIFSMTDAQFKYIINSASRSSLQMFMLLLCRTYSIHAK